MRRVELWNEGWSFIREEVREPKDFTSWVGVSLPHTWNNIDGQDGGNDYWRGTSTYAKAFARPVVGGKERSILEFGGVAMTAQVYLNGTLLTTHAGGYSTFRVDLTDYLEEENLLLVYVDNSDNDTVYPQKADFTFYGGIYRDVKLITIPEKHLELLRDGNPGIKVTPILTEDNEKATITVETWSNGGDRVRMEILDQGAVLFSETAAAGDARLDFSFDHPHLWAGVEDPYLYEARVTLFQGDEELDQVSTSFGIRRFSVDPDKGFFLNGKSYPLRGVSRHQDRLGLGNAITLQEHQEDMALIKEVGANTIRLAHYQHSQEFYDLCDRNGMVVWAEIPYITFHMEGGRANTISQMRELVTQNYNHPSIICWGLSNEITASGIVTEDLVENHRILNDLCHEMDKTRLTTMAHAFMLEMESPVTTLPDIASYNLYFGWYLGELEQNGSFLDDYHRMHPDRCLGLAEYGADANPNYQTNAPERADYTETYQCVYHESLIRQINERPYLWATHVWNMFDFAADGRDEGGKPGRNQKGLVTFDRKTKKDSFYLYKAEWNHREPFVHLAGRRYVDRTEEVTLVKVYSNQSHVDLYVDGVFFGGKDSHTVFDFMVPISGDHTLTARSGELEDTIRVRKVKEQNKAYLYRKKGSVINWFDRESYRKDAFSLDDRYADLLAHPEACALVKVLMDRLNANRSDVAKSCDNNKNLQKMMGEMKFTTLLKSYGDRVTEEELVELNKELQKIRKA